MLENFFCLAADLCCSEPLILRACPGRQDWEELLEANIKAGYSASNTAHLNAIKVTAKNLEEILEQQVKCQAGPRRCFNNRRSTRVCSTGSPHTVVRVRA
jgi:hypothetical protein